MEIRKKLKTAARIIKEEKWSALGGKIKLRRRQRREAKNYQKWLLKNQITETDREKMRLEIAGFSHKPLVTIILPVYNIEEIFLRKCIESVIGQIYENWELCVADDCSPAPHVRRVLEEYTGKDERIKVVFRAANGHISAASNSALEVANGEFTGLLDHDDELSEDALFQVVKEINEFPETGFIYTDEDMIGAAGNRFHPKFKPDWSLDFFHSVNYVTHFAVYRTAILRKIGGFRAGFEGSQDYDLALRFIEQIDEKQIRHIPKILYHWRVIEGSVAFSSDAKPYAHERARDALREHFERTGEKANVERGIYEFHRVRYELPENPPPVSLILSSNADFESSVKSAEAYLKETDYQNLEIVLICPEHVRNHSIHKNIQAVFRENFSKAESFNRAVSQSKGEVLCFVDLSLRALSKDWLTELISFAMQKEVGAVGGKILTRDEAISDGAFILGFGGTPRAANKGLPRETDEGLYRTRVVSNFSAVSANCLAVRREIFDKTGGFNAENFPNSLFDADFCLRLRQQNLRVVFTPYAELVQIEKSDSQSKPTANEKDYFIQKWQSAIRKDLFYNPNLSPTGETFTIKI